MIGDSMMLKTKDGSLITERPINRMYWITRDKFDSDFAIFSLTREAHEKGTILVSYTHEYNKNKELKVVGLVEFQ